MGRNEAVAKRWAAAITPTGLISTEEEEENPHGGAEKEDPENEHTHTHTQKISQERRQEKSSKPLSNEEKWINKDSRIFEEGEEEEEEEEKEAFLPLSDCLMFFCDKYEWSKILVVIIFECA